MDIKNEILETIKSAIKNPDIIKLDNYIAGPLNTQSDPCIGHYKRTHSLNTYNQIILDSDKKYQVYFNSKGKSYLISEKGKKIQVKTDLDFDKDEEYQKVDAHYFDLSIKGKSNINIDSITEDNLLSSKRGVFISKGFFSKEYPFTFKKTKQEIVYYLTYNGFRYKLEKEEVDELYNLFEEEYERIKIQDLEEIKNYKK